MASGSDSEDDLEALRLAALRSKKSTKPRPPSESAAGAAVGAGPVVLLPWFDRHRPPPPPWPAPQYGQPPPTTTELWRRGGQSPPPGYPQPDAAWPASGGPALISIVPVAADPKPTTACSASVTHRIICPPRRRSSRSAQESTKFARIDHSPSDEEEEEQEQDQTAAAAFEMSAPDSAGHLADAVVADSEDKGGSAPSDDDADVIDMGLGDDFDKMLAEFEDFVENPAGEPPEPRPRRRRERRRRSGGRPPGHGAAAAAGSTPAAVPADVRRGDRHTSPATGVRPERQAAPPSPPPLRQSGSAATPGTAVRNSRAESPADKRAAITSPARRYGRSISPDPAPPPSPPHGRWAPRPLPLTQEEFIRRLELGLPLRDESPPPPPSAAFLRRHTRSRSRSPLRRRRRSLSPPEPDWRRQQTPSLSPERRRSTSPALHRLPAGRLTRRQGGGGRSVRRGSMSPPGGRRGGGGGGLARRQWEDRQLEAWRAQRRLEAAAAAAGATGGAQDDSQRTRQEQDRRRTERPEAKRRTVDDGRREDGRLTQERRPPEDARRRLEGRRTEDRRRQHGQHRRRSEERREQEEATQLRQQEKKRRLQEKEAKQQAEREERLKRLPSPERQRALRRQQKFERNNPVVVQRQTIRLRSRVAAEESAADGCSGEQRCSAAPASATRAPGRSESVGESEALELELGLDDDLRHMERELANCDGPAADADAAATTTGSQLQSDCAVTGGAASSPADRRRGRDRRPAHTTSEPAGRRVVVVDRVSSPAEQMADTDVSASRRAPSIFSRLGSGKPSNASKSADSDGGRRKLRFRGSSRDGARGAASAAASTAAAPRDPLESHLRKIRARNVAIVRRSREVATDKHLYG